MATNPIPTDEFAAERLHERAREIDQERSSQTSVNGHHHRHHLNWQRPSVDQRVAVLESLRRTGQNTSNHFPSHDSHERHPSFREG